MVGIFVVAPSVVTRLTVVVTCPGCLDVADSVVEEKSVECGTTDVVPNSVVVCSTFFEVVTPTVVKPVSPGAFVVVGTNVGILEDVVVINAVCCTLVVAIIVLVDVEGAWVVDTAIVATWCCVELVSTPVCVVMACSESVVVVNIFGAIVTIPRVDVVARGIEASVVAGKIEVVAGVVVGKIFICVVVATNFGTSQVLVT